MVTEEYVFIPSRKDEKITGIITVPDAFVPGQNRGVILSHGSTNGMFFPLLVHMANVFAESGYIALRFNFPFRDQGKKNPDSDESLTNSWVSVYKYLKTHPEYSPSSIIAAGKSLGGRIATQAAAAHLMDVDGLILLGYPLHTPDRKDILRDANLYRISVPMLFFAGTNDAFCNTEVLKGVLDNIKASCTIEIIEGGDHSLRLPASSGISDEQIYARIIARSLSWLHTI